MKLVCDCGNEAKIDEINKEEDGVNTILQFYTFEVISTIHGNLVIKCKKCKDKRKGLL